MSARLVALRVDVDTHEGMKRGVPSLYGTLARAGVSATFYFAMGPDRSGRAIFNVFKPGFLAKMTKSGAASVYGWRTILSGTLLPSRPVATAFPEIARRGRDEGHETGVHAWDHRTWQDKLFRMSDAHVARELDRGRAAYVDVYGEAPRTFAAPAWLSDARSLAHQETFALDHASDCRGREPFLPRVAGRVLATPQIPATLPTLDEGLGRTHTDPDAWFDAMLDAATAQEWPVFTLHAELEGGPYAAHFARFLARGRARGLEFGTLGELLARRRAAGELPVCEVTHAPVEGRHGVLATQGERLGS